MTSRYKLNTAVRELPPSGIRRFFDLVLSVPDVISLGVGEPDFKTPWNVREFAIHEIESGHTAYSSNHGLPELRRELANWLNKKYDVHYDPIRETLITVGASEAIDIALRAILEHGDEVVVVEPCYVSYKPTVILAGGIPVVLTTTVENGFCIDIEELISVCTQRTKAIIINYPSNPTGGTLNRQQLEQLAEFCIERGILVISDEIYAELSYEGRHVSLASIPGMKEWTILISGFSKSHAMTGWRLGYACAPAEIIESMVKIHQYTMLCAPTISQYAAIEALRNSDEDIESMREEYETRRNLIVRRMNEAGLPTLMPKGAFYAFSRVDHLGISSEEFCARLLKEKKVAIVPGNAFGKCGEGFVRASYASSLQRIDAATQRIADFVRILESKR